MIDFKKYEDLFKKNDGFNWHGNFKLKFDYLKLSLTSV